MPVPLCGLILEAIIEKKNTISESSSPSRSPLNSRETASCISAQPRLKPVSSPLSLIHFEKLAVQSGGLGGSRCATHLGPRKSQNGRRGASFVIELTICRRLSLMVVEGINFLILSLM